MVGFCSRKPRLPTFCLHLGLIEVVARFIYAYIIDKVDKLALFWWTNFLDGIFLGALLLCFYSENLECC